MSIIFETERCIFKMPQKKDIHYWQSLDNLMREEVDKNLTQHILDFDKNGFGMGSVFSKMSQQFIGRAGLYYYPLQNEKKQAIELGIAIHPYFQNQGYAVEITKKLLEWGFETLAFELITALVTTQNLKSQRVLEKCGLQYEKTIRIETENFYLFTMKSCRTMPFRI